MSHPLPPPADADPPVPSSLGGTDWDVLLDALPQPALLLRAGALLAANAAARRWLGGAVVAGTAIEVLPADADGPALDDAPAGRARLRIRVGTAGPSPARPFGWRSLPGRPMTLLVADEQTDLEQMRAIARRLLRDQEDERRILARGLHGGTSQALTVIKLAAHAALGEDDEAQRREELHGLLAQADAAILDLRELSARLRPPPLDALGLEAALRWQIGRPDRPAVPELVAQIAALPRRPCGEVEQAAFRIAQEGLANARDHAGATRIELVLQPCDADHLRLRVHDDGAGFDLASSQGIGLALMRERARLVGGHCSIASIPGRGTTVEAILPYEAAPARVPA